MQATADRVWPAGDQEASDAVHVLRGALSPLRVFAATAELRKTSLLEAASSKDDYVVDGAAAAAAAAAAPAAAPAAEPPERDGTSGVLRTWGLFGDKAAAAAAAAEPGEGEEESEREGGKEGEMIGAVGVSPAGQVKLYQLEQLPMPALRTVRPFALPPPACAACQIASAAHAYAACQIAPGDAESVRAAAHAGAAPRAPLHSSFVCLRCLPDRAR